MAESFAGQQGQSVFHRGLYLHEYTLAGNNEPFSIPLENVAAPVDEDDMVSYYLPGIQISLSDMGIPERRVIIEGEFPSLEHVRDNTIRRFDADSGLVVRWGGGAYEREDDYYERLDAGSWLCFNIADWEWRLDRPLNRRAQLNVSFRPEASTVLAIARESQRNYLGILATDGMLGKVSYWGQEPLEPVAHSQPNSFKDPWPKNDHCKVMGIDTDFYNSLTREQKQELIQSTRKRLAAMFHPDHGGDAERLKLINNAADRLLKN